MFWGDGLRHSFILYLSYGPLDQDTRAATARTRRTTS